jgi:hypothetical protein
MDPNSITLMSVGERYIDQTEELTSLCVDYAVNNIFQVFDKTK